MAVYLLDSDAIIDWLKGKRSALLVRDLLAQGHTLACCAINVIEVYSGVLPHEMDKTESLLRALDYLEITAETARRAGLLRRDNARKGIVLSLADATIAAVAMASGAVLVTHNRKHFPVPGLEIHP
jgi:predicted nucleic acid-binding protein